MAYNPITDFMALLRQTSGGVRTESIPGLDYILAAMARAGMFTLSVGATAPVSNQATTVWLQPATQSWSREGTVYVWNISSSAYEPATPALWSALFVNVAAAQITQDINSIGPTLINVRAGVVRVLNVGAAVGLTLPPASTKFGSVLIADWLNIAGTNNITIGLSGTDKFPNGGTTWTIAADGGSIFARPVTGGYVL